MKHSVQSAQAQARAKLLCVDGMTMDHIIAIDNEIAKLIELVPDLSVSSLKAFLQSIGWIIQPFDEFVLSCLKLESFACGKQSFSVDADEIKLVFLRTEENSTSNQLRLLLHEAGHILLHHNLKQMGALEEAQANYFEFCCMLNYVFPVKKPTRNRTRSFAAIVLLCVLFIFLFFSAWHVLESDTILPSGTELSYTAGKGEETELSSDTMVYITSAGEKFHKAGCMYIRDKSNVIQLTIKEAQALKKEPCSKCFGDEITTSSAAPF